MNCQDFREIIDSYLCDELLTETNHEVLRHLEACAQCRQVTEARRALRSRLRSAVVNAPQYRVREDFHANLRAQLKQTAFSTEDAKKIGWTKNISRLAIAAGLLIAVGLGFWFLLEQTHNSLSAETARINDKADQNISLANYAVGDHQNCAIKYNLLEEPIDINLAAAEYADLRQTILNPLENAPDKYEFVESHVCKYQNHSFTHIVVHHQGKTVSILLTDAGDAARLKSAEIARYIVNNYQTARFDVGNRAVFVVSDLSEQENYNTAVLLETHINRKITAETSSQPAILTDSKFSNYQTSFDER